MKKILIGVALLCAAGCMKRVTRFRSDMKSCTGGNDGAITCNGKPSAQVECFQPRSNSCRAMAVRYADGERVWIFQPMGFDPDDPEASAQEDSPVILQPEMSRDASLIWYHRSNGYQGVWETYDPLTGVFDEVDGMGLMRLRSHQYDEGPISLVPGK